MRTAPLAILLVASASLAPGAELHIDKTPTVDLPGYLTFTLSIDPAEGEDLRGIDATFTGPMNQVLFGSEEVLSWEFGPPCFNCDPPWEEITNQDSHLLFDPDGPGGGSPFLLTGEESDESLIVLIAGLQFIDPPVGPTPVAQIVIPYGDTVDYELEFDLGGGEAVPFAGTLRTDFIFGDCDCDGDIDIVDFGGFADAFGSFDPVDRCYDSEPDGDVDVIDFGLFADNFGIGVAVAIPEPTAALAAFTGLLAAAATQRR